MIPRGRRDCWLTAAVIAMLLWEGMRRRWRRVVVGVAAFAAARRPAMRTHRRRGRDALTAEDKRRLEARAGRARREENDGDARG